MVNRGPIEVQWLRSCWVSVPRRRKTSLGRVLSWKNIYIRQNQRDNPSQVTRSDSVTQTALSLVVFWNNWNDGFSFHRAQATPLQVPFYYNESLSICYFYFPANGWLYARTLFQWMTKTITLTLGESCRSKVKPRNLYSSSSFKLNGQIKRLDTIFCSTVLISLRKRKWVK